MAIDIELHDAELRTDDWKRRHSSESIFRLGAWRWRGVRCESEYILDRLAMGNVVDFGGFDGPLGFASIVVDSQAKIKCLSGLPGRVNTIFTSHTLEHVDDIITTLGEIRDALKPWGVLIAHVPAWTCKRWRAGDYSNPNQPTGHHVTFALRGDPVDTGAAGAITLDGLIEEHVGTIIRACHCGDDSLMIIARKS